MNLVCLFVRVFQSHQKSQIHEILVLGLIWANLKHVEARFFEILIFKWGSPYGPVLKNVFFAFFSKISAISTHRTMEFLQSEYLYEHPNHGLIV